jgi:hypothetical protein
MNNYWNTNFPITQPGRHRFRYGLLTHAAFHSDVVRAQASAFANPLIVHRGFSARTTPGA